MPFAEQFGEMPHAPENRPPAPAEQPAAEREPATVEDFFTAWEDEEKNLWELERIDQEAELASDEKHQAAIAERRTEALQKRDTLSERRRAIQEELFENGQLNDEAEPRAGTLLRKRLADKTWRREHPALVKVEYVRRLGDLFSPVRQKAETMNPESVYNYLVQKDKDTTHGDLRNPIIEFAKEKDALDQAIAAELPQSERLIAERAYVSAQDQAVQNLYWQAQDLARRDA